VGRIVARRRTGNKRLGKKVFTYFDEQEHERLLTVLKMKKRSKSGYVAELVNAEVDKILGPAPVNIAEPLSLQDVVEALKKNRDVEGLVGTNGIGFKWTDEAERILRKAGARVELLFLIHKAIHKK